MNTPINKFWMFPYTNKEWTCMKVLLILVWLKFMIKIVTKYTVVNMPKAICSVLNCEYFLNFPAKVVLVLLCIILALMYLFEKKMAWITFLIFIISVLLFTIEESNGILKRNSLFSFIFFAQFLAYFFKKSHTGLVKDRIQFSIQVVAAGYTLSAISKIADSGIGWFLDGQLMILQILKSAYYSYADYNANGYIERGNIIVNYISNHPILVTVLLFCTLFLELFALLSTVNKKVAFYYGLLLLAMHIGIYLVLNIKIDGVLYPMVIFFINPLFLIISMFTKLFDFLKFRMGIAWLKK